MKDLKVIFIVILTSITLFYCCVHTYSYSATFEFDVENTEAISLISIKYCIDSINIDSVESLVKEKYPNVLDSWLKTFEYKINEKHIKGLDGKIERKIFTIYFNMKTAPNDEEYLLAFDYYSEIILKELKRRGYKIYLLGNKLS